MTTNLYKRGACSALATESKPMINFEAIIRHFGAEAVRHLATDVDSDDRALDALTNKNASGRTKTLRNWFYYYRVLRGISDEKGLAVASAVLQWVDTRDLGESPSTIESMEQAHADLMAVCSKAYGRDRNFRSLASKALWLCDPHHVPIFDRLAQRALWVIAKLENGGLDGIADSPEYRQFLDVWMLLYERYVGPLNEIEMPGYPYRVRIFDRILWMIGKDSYQYPV